MWPTTSFFNIYILKPLKQTLKVPYTDVGQKHLWWSESNLMMAKKLNFTIDRKQLTVTGKILDSG